MSTLHVSEKTNQGMPPQFLALESTPADEPGVGTKRGVETRSEDRVAGCNMVEGRLGTGPATCLCVTLSGRLRLSSTVA